MCALSSRVRFFGLTPATHDSRLKNMAKRDYYEVLGWRATPRGRHQERRLAMKHHRTAIGRQVGEAKFKGRTGPEILADAQKRAAYDQFGRRGRSQHGGRRARRREFPGRRRRAEFATSLVMCSATSSAVVVVAGGAVRYTAAPTTLQPRAVAKKRCVPRRIRVPTLEACDTAKKRRQGRDRGHVLRDLRRPRPGAHAAGFFHQQTCPRAAVAAR